MHDIMQLTLDAGGIGVVYWEPAWVSTKCKTRWAQGSDWENAAFFDYKGKALPALEWPKAAYVWPVEVTFAMADHGQTAQYLTGDFTGRVTVTMQKTGGRFVYQAWLRPETHVVVGTAESESALDDAEAFDVTVPKTGGPVVLGTPQP